MLNYKCNLKIQYPCSGYLHKDVKIKIMKLKNLMIPQLQLLEYLDFIQVHHQ